MVGFTVQATISRAFVRKYSIRTVEVGELTGVPSGTAVNCTEWREKNLSLTLSSGAGCCSASTRPVL